MKRHFGWIVLSLAALTACKTTSGREAGVKDISDGGAFLYFFADNLVQRGKCPTFGVPYVRENCGEDLEGMDLDSFASAIRTAASGVSPQEFRTLSTTVATLDGQLLAIDRQLQAEPNADLETQRAELAAQRAQAQARADLRNSKPNSVLLDKVISKLKNDNIAYIIRSGSSIYAEEQEVTSKFGYAFGDPQAN